MSKTMSKNSTSSVANLAIFQTTLATIFQKHLATNLAIFFYFIGNFQQIDKLLKR